MLSHMVQHQVRLIADSFVTYHQKWQQNLRTEDIAVTTGGSEALLFVLQLFVILEMKFWFQRHFTQIIMVSPQ